ncbi:MAG TPA: hypothetical protein VH877_25885 [Polyangia bacterium]|jgi:hypothetical protein|nr:hypothetical protein [Polyangia bacterium]
MMETWLVQQQGRETFLTQEELGRWARAGQIASGDLVFHPLQGRWLYASQVDEIRQLVEAPATRGDMAAPEARGDMAAPEARALVPYGRAQMALATDGGPHNDAAIAGFTLSLLGIIPLFGAVCALVGLPLSLRGVHRAQALGGTDRRFAIAGMVMSLTSLLLHGGVTLLALLDY